MSANVRPFRWSGRAEHAAALVADDRLTEAQIGAAVGITDRQLRRWQAHPDFAARVIELRAALVEAVMRKGIADKRKRVAAYNDRWERMQRVIEERAVSEEMRKIAGGTTGLLVHRERAIGTGANQQVTHEYEVDTGLLGELRATEKQAAQEVGDWTEKREVRGDKDAPIHHEHHLDLKGLSREDLETLEVVLARAAPEPR